MTSFPKSFRIILKAFDPQWTSRVTSELSRLFQVDDQTASSIVSAVPIVVVDEIGFRHAYEVRTRLQPLADAGCTFVVTDEISEEVPRINWPELPEFARWDGPEEAGGDDTPRRRRSETTVEASAPPARMPADLIFATFNCPSCNEAVGLVKVSDVDGSVSAKRAPTRAGITGGAGARAPAVEPEPPAVEIDDTPEIGEPWAPDSSTSMPAPIMGESEDPSDESVTDIPRMGSGFDLEDPLLRARRATRALESGRLEQVLDEGLDDDDDDDSDDVFVPEVEESKADDEPVIETAARTAPPPAPPPPDPDDFSGKATSPDLEAVDDTDDEPPIGFDSEEFPVPAAARDEPKKSGDLDPFAGQKLFESGEFEAPKNFEPKEPPPADDFLADVDPEPAASGRNRSPGGEGDDDESPFPGSSSELDHKALFGDTQEDVTAGAASVVAKDSDEFDPFESDSGEFPPVEPTPAKAEKPKWDDEESFSESEMDAIVGRPPPPKDADDDDDPFPDDDRLFESDDEFPALTGTPVKTTEPAPGGAFDSDEHDPFFDSREDDENPFGASDSGRPSLLDDDDDDDDDDLFGKPEKTPDPFLDSRDDDGDDLFGKPEKTPDPFLDSRDDDDDLFGTPAATKAPDPFLDSRDDEDDDPFGAAPSKAPDPFLDSGDDEDDDPFKASRADDDLSASDELFRQTRADEDAFPSLKQQRDEQVRSEVSSLLDSTSGSGEFGSGGEVNLSLLDSDDELEAEGLKAKTPLDKNVPDFANESDELDAMPTIDDSIVGDSPALDPFGDSGDDFMMAQSDDDVPGAADSGPTSFRKGMPYDEAAKLFESGDTEPLDDGDGLFPVTDPSSLEGGDLGLEAPDSQEVRAADLAAAARETAPPDMAASDSASNADLRKLDFQETVDMLGDDRGVRKKRRSGRLMRRGLVPMAASDEDFDPLGNSPGPRDAKSGRLKRSDPLLRDDQSSDQSRSGRTGVDPFARARSGRTKADPFDSGSVGQMDSSRFNSSEPDVLASPRLGGGPSGPVKEGGGEYGLVLSRISNDSKRDEAARLIAEIQGLGFDDALRLTERTIIPVLKGVSKETAETHLEEFKRRQITGRVTKRRSGSGKSALSRRHG